jgi:hypothetical protein
MIALAPIKPPDTSESVYDLSRDLRGVRLRVRLEWRERRAGWYASIWLAGVLLIQGRRLVEGNPLLWRHRFDGLPTDVADGRIRYGRLYLVALSGDRSECDQAGLGWTHVLYWADPDDQGAASSRVVEVS